MKSVQKASISGRDSFNGSQKMSSNSVDACTHAREEIERLERRLRDISEFYFTVGSALAGSPPRLTIDNADIPARREMGPNWLVPKVDYCAWPEKETVKETLRAYYEAETAYAEAWRALPPDARSQFPRPTR
jgi:hypothetical protein